MEGTFCFVDMSGFTALTEAHGDETGADLVDRFVTLIGAAINPTSTQLVGTSGDGAFLFAPRVEDALRSVENLFALAVSEQNFPTLRAGLHHGHALARNGTYFGASVNLAARVTSQTRGSQVLGTTIIADAARRHGWSVRGIGAFKLRNVREPVDLFVLGLVATDHGSVIDPVCRMSLDPETASGRLRHEDKDYWFCSLQCVASFAKDPNAFIVR